MQIIMSVFHRQCIYMLFKLNLQLKYYCKKTLAEFKEVKLFALFILYVNSMRYRPIVIFDKYVIYAKFANKHIS